jgi:hypothetical protein
LAKSFSLSLGVMKTLAAMLSAFDAVGTRLAFWYCAGVRL